MKIRPKIAVDLDDVVVNHYEALAAFHNARYGTSHTVDDYISDHWSKVWHVSEEETERRAREFAALGVKDRQLKPGALAALKTLHRSYDLAVVTVRRKVNVDPTLEWLAAELPGLFDEVRFVPIWEEQNCPSKADICLEIGASYLIDDSLKHCRLAAEAGVRAVLFGNYAWNQAPDGLPGDVTRCNDWKAVLGYFNEQDN